MSNVLRFLAGALGLATLVAFLQQSGAQPGPSRLTDAGL